MGFAHLVEDYGFTHERLAERVGKSRPSVANALRLLTLSDAIKAKLRGGAISMGHAKALLAVEAAERERVAERILRDGLSVRDVERLAERRKPRAPRTAAPGPRKSPDLAAAEDRLRYRLGAPVQLVPLPAGGRIEIRYADEDDLARVVDLLLGEGS
jgi:ParB family chromosome partitioning protein